MFINPKEVIRIQWITGINDLATQIQPNCVDFTLDELFLVSSRDRAFISNNKKIVNMRQLHPVQLTNNIWDLDGMCVYDGTSNAYVRVPEGYACVPVFTRSTLARNGIFLISGLYDSGYEGHIGFTLYTIGGPVSIEKGTRVGQIGFVKAENAHMYDGNWKHEQGTHYTEALGQKQIPSNPKRKDVGMGAILNTDSEFV